MLLYSPYKNSNLYEINDTNVQNKFYNNTAQKEAI